MKGSKQDPMTNSMKNAIDTTRQRLATLRSLMKEKGYDAVIVPTGDYHMSEYTGDYFKCREFITGFTGSAGTAVIFKDDVSVPSQAKNDAGENPCCGGLWTDSRYYIQAEQQLEGTGLRLFKVGQPSTPTIIRHICEELPEGSRVACDGRIISFDTFAEWYDALDDAGIELDEQADLIGEIWKVPVCSGAGADSNDDFECRPPLPAGRAFEYDIKYCGKSRAEKLSWLCSQITDRGADAHILTNLDDIAWLLNIRGSDVHCNPVVLSYFLAERTDEDPDNAAETASEATSGSASEGAPEAVSEAASENRTAGHNSGWRLRLFANAESFSDELVAALAADGVMLSPSESISEALSDLECSSILLSATDTNSYLYGLIPPEVYIAESENPTALAKAVKNQVETDNARAAHLKDGIALTKFIYWLKVNVCSADADNYSQDAGCNRTAAIESSAATESSATITEMTAAEKLYELRSAQDNFMGNSFDPIIAYGEHAAIVHYSATKETDVPLKPRGLVLCDTGAHYLEGTTDVTRTIALGQLTPDELKMSTTVLRGHIALASAVFPRGLNGGNLDYLAHAPLWELGKDYGHGTGHGVGHFLNVHEGPNYIHWSRNGNTGTTPPFEPGMITSCEPGYYEDGMFGIRHESLILCKPFVCEAVNSDAFSGADDGGEDDRPLRSDLLCFEELTMVPFDPDSIDFEALEKRDRRFLADYHATIYERISPHLDPDEREWLRRICDAFEV